MNRKSFSKLIVVIIMSFVVCLLGVVSTAQAEQHKQNQNNYIAIIIDDMGYKLQQDTRAIQLPGKVTYAFLPYAPNAKNLAKTANARNNEIMLHLPMQPLEPLFLGPGALTIDMTEQEFKRTVVDNILSVPYVKGVNNHMGSLVTSEPQAMKWLMETLTDTGLFFVDSRTTAHTLAQQTADKYQIENTRRHIFLDHKPTKQNIEKQFKKLVQLAKKQGVAVAIGHPLDATLEVLEQQIPQLDSEGVKLVPVSKIIALEQQMQQPQKQTFELSETFTPHHSHDHNRSVTAWQTSSSHSHKAVKN